VLLKEKNGTRMLPIWIGPSEASAIAIQLTGRQFQRPLTHDLLKSVIEGLEAKVPKIAIIDLREKTYYAKVYLERAQDDVLAIDARPSDCIALALRTGSPIFVREELLRDENNVEEMTSEQTMEQLQKQLEDMDPDEFGKLWT
jgi:bifunctional DNase/RNase